jgi:hypothetical protein
MKLQEKISHCAIIRTMMTESENTALFIETTAATYRLQIDRRARRDTFYA